jgi:predicted dehydrogenase
MWDEVRIFGEKGLIELRRPSTLPTGWALTWTLGDGSVREQLAAEQGAGFITREFLAALHRGSPVSCTFDDAALSVEIIEAAFESAERQQRGRGDIRISMSAG